MTDVGLSLLVLAHK